MADLARPEYGTPWASEGERVAPTQDKVELGWVQEMMPFQWENYLQNRQDSAITYLLQKGIPEYSDTQEYIAQKSAVLYMGAVYIATQTVTGVLPTVTASWKRLSTISDASGVVSITGGGTGASTASGARTNLGLGTASVLDADVVVQKDASGNFSAGTITASLAGNATSAGKWKTARTINVVGAATSDTKSMDGTANTTLTISELDATKLVGVATVNTSGNAATATKLQTARTITLTGGASGVSNASDGSTDFTIGVTSLNASALSSGTVPTSALNNAVTKTSPDGAAKLPKGSTSQRPLNPEFGDFRGNETTGLLEYWNGFNWVSPSQYAADLVVMKSGSAMTGNLTVPSLNGGQLAGMRNRIINGKMDIAQRGVNFPNVADSTYTLDRWKVEKSVGHAVTVSSSFDVPAALEFQSSIRVAVTTADTVISSSDYSVLTQVIEGYNVRDLIGRTFTLSFWVRSSKTGTHCIGLRNSALDYSYVVEYNISSANTWEYKTVKVTGGLIISGGWIWNNSAGLHVSFSLASGTSYQTEPNKWEVGNRISTANQVNCLDTVGNIFAITGVQLEAGEVATPFEHRPHGVELALCQRYFYKTYSQGVTPGTVNILDGGMYGAVTGSGNYYTLGCRFPVTMRATPSVIIYSTKTGAAGLVTRDGVEVPALPILPGTTGVTVRINNNLSAQDQFVSAHLTASSEL